MTQVLAVAPRAGPDAVLGGQRADARGQSPQRQYRRYARERYLPVLGAAKFEFQGASSSTSSAGHPRSWPRNSGASTTAGTTRSGWLATSEGAHQLHEGRLQPR